MLVLNRLPHSASLGSVVSIADCNSKGHWFKTSKQHILSCSFCRELQDGILTGWKSRSWGTSVNSARLQVISFTSLQFGIYEAAVTSNWVVLNTQLHILFACTFKDCWASVTCKVEIVECVLGSAHMIFQVPTPCAQIIVVLGVRVPKQHAKQVGHAYSSNLLRTGEVMWRNHITLFRSAHSNSPLAHELRMWLIAIYLDIMCHLNSNIQYWFYKLLAFSTCQYITWLKFLNAYIAICLHCITYIFLV